MALLTQRQRTLALQPGESLRIVDASGAALLEIVSSVDGPMLRLAQSDSTLDVSGKLRIHADEIEMIAREGELKMLAKDDVVVRGETIRLN